MIASYFLGAVPFGVLIAKSKGIDIMKEGSGNIGATNVLRVLGPGPGLLAFALDCLKGAIPAIVAQQLGGGLEWGFAAGMVSVVGHSLSPFIGFKGGKGVATAFGALLGSTTLVAISAFAVFLIVVAVTRYVSLGSICACLALIFFTFFYQSPIGISIPLSLLGLFVIYRHKANIVRLKNGTESKISFKKSSNENSQPSVASTMKEEPDEHGDS